MLRGSSQGGNSGDRFVCTLSLVDIRLAVGRHSLKLLRSATGPSYLDFSLRRRSEAKVQPRVIRREIASAGTNHPILSHSARHDLYAGTYSLTVTFCPHQL